MKKLILFFIFIAIVFITGSFICEINNNTNSTTTTTTSTTDELEGTWISPCYNLSDVYDRIDTWVFSGDSFTWNEVHYYAGGTCSTLYSPNPGHSASGTFSIGNPFTADGGESVMEFDMNIDGMGMYYNLYYLAEGKLYFGDDSGDKDGLTPENRLTAVETDCWIIKQ